MRIGKMRSPHGVPSLKADKASYDEQMQYFHLTRADGTTAAQRLFDHEVPDLFEWVVGHMGEHPLARQSKKTQRPKPFHLEGFPA